MGTDYTKKASEVSGMLNSFSFSDRMFCEAMGMEHRTLQQSFTRLCLAWLKHCSGEDYERLADGRNEASHRTAKAIIEYCEEADIYLGLPLV